MFDSFVAGTVTLTFTTTSVAAGATLSEAASMGTTDIPEYFQLAATDLVMIQPQFQSEMTGVHASVQVADAGTYGARGAIVGARKLLVSFTNSGSGALTAHSGGTFLVIVVKLN